MISIRGKSETFNKMDNRLLDLDWLPTVEKTQELLFSGTLTNSNFSFSIPQGSLSSGDNVIYYIDGVKYETYVIGFGASIGFGSNSYLF